MLLFSGGSEASLNATITQHRSHIEANKDSVSDVAYTLALHRRHLSHRASALLVENKLVNISHKNRESGGSPSIAMIFTGQGSQWQGMGKELMERSDSFRADIKEMDAILHGLKNPPSWLLSGTC